MRFYWNYHPRYWQGLEKTGLLDGDVGVRLAHSPYAPDDLLTNQALKRDGDLWRLIMNHSHGLLIDRGCGGIEYKAYQFDKSLLDDLAAHLGDKFLGIQMHEWYSNMVNDYSRIKDAGGVEIFAHQIASGEQDLLQNHFEYGEPRDFLGRKFPASIDEFLAEADHHYARKSQDFHQYVNLTDSYYQSYWKGYQNGARHTMAEIGGQTGLTRLQIASARGAARAFGRPWGVYYEQWACPLSVLWYNRNYSAWQIPAAMRDAYYFVQGGRGGSSRALQYRLLYYSLLAGATSIAEEWGAENTFLDWESFELTDYGRVMAEFFKFSHQTDVGHPVTKVAIVLDPQGSPLDTNYLDERFPTMLRFYEPSDRDALIKDRLRTLFGAAVDDEAYGEPHTLTSGVLPDTFDIVYSDISPDALAGYSIVYYLGNDTSACADRFSSFPGTVIDGTSADSLDRLTTSLREQLPVWVEGDVAWTVNETKDGWILGLFNNRGVIRSVDADETYDSSQAVDVTLHLPNARVGGLLPAGRVAPQDEDVVTDGLVTKITIPPGDCRLVHLRPAI